MAVNKLSKAHLHMQPFELHTLETIESAAHEAW